jgi:glycosyltransferase involved in cell wall biosynthesis
VSSDLRKVLFCTFDVVPEPTGTSARTTEFVRALNHTFSSDGLTAKSPDHGHIERFHGMRLMRVPVGAGDLPSRVLAFERAVRRQLESEEYALAHFTDPFGGYALCELRQDRDHDFKLVYDVRGFPSVELKYTHPHLEGDRRFVAKLRRQELFCLMNADHVIVGSEVTARMVEGFGVSRSRVTCIPPSVDASYYPEGAMPTPCGEPLRLLYLGSQASWQGLATLLSAVAIAGRSRELRLSIVGARHPTWRLQLEEMVKVRELGGVVSFEEPVAPEHLQHVLSACDVGVVPLEPSERNTLQGAPVTKVSHYLAAGRPVIAADLPLLREITSEACAVFHRAGDDTDLAARIVELAADPARRVAMGEAARAFAAERLSSRRAREALLAVYCRLLDLPVPVLPPDQPRVAESVSPDAPTPVGVPLEPGPDSAPRDVPTETHGRPPETPGATPSPYETPTASEAPVPHGMSSAMPAVVHEADTDPARAARGPDAPEREPARGADHLTDPSVDDSASAVERVPDDRSDRRPTYRAALDALFDEPKGQPADRSISPSPVERKVGKVLEAARALEHGESLRADGSGDGPPLLGPPQGAEGATWSRSAAPEFVRAAAARPLPPPPSTPVIRDAATAFLPGISLPAAHVAGALGPPPRPASAALAPAGMPGPEPPGTLPESSEAALTPIASGATCSDEWYEHLIAGYAPFGFPVRPPSS